MKVLAVASEMYPLVKTGGLADVVGALPSALAPLGVTVATLVPGYPAVMTAFTSVEVIASQISVHGGMARVVSGMAKGTGQTMHNVTQHCRKLRHSWHVERMPDT
jgi:starch synthase